MKKITRQSYSDMYGPTTGDKIRLADTELFIEVEKDLTTYGEEVKFGGGKVIRDGMGQSQVTNKDGAVDTSTLSISLIGTNAENYADDIARNDVHLLENFAGTSAPTAGTVLTGQLWYDKTDDVLRVYNLRM